MKRTPKKQGAEDMGFQKYIESLIEMKRNRVVFCSTCGAKMGLTEIVHSMGGFSTTTGNKNVLNLVRAKCPNRKWYHIIKHKDRYYDETLRIDYGYLFGL